jgi:hypothetical protein
MNGLDRDFQRDVYKGHLEKGAQFRLFQHSVHIRALAQSVAGALDFKKVKLMTDKTRKEMLERKLVIESTTYDEQPSDMRKELAEITKGIAEADKRQASEDAKSEKVLAIMIEMVKQDLKSEINQAISQQTGHPSRALREIWLAWEESFKGQPHEILEEIREMIKQVKGAGNTTEMLSMLQELKTLHTLVDTWLSTVDENGNRQNVDDENPPVSNKEWIRKFCQRCTSPELAKFKSMAEVELIKGTSFMATAEMIIQAQLLEVSIMKMTSGVVPPDVHAPFPSPQVHQQQHHAQQAHLVMQESNQEAFSAGFAQGRQIRGVGLGREDDQGHYPSGPSGYAQKRARVESEGATDHYAGHSQGHPNPHFHQGPQGGGMGYQGQFYQRGSDPVVCRFWDGFGCSNLQRYGRCAYYHPPTGGGSDGSGSAGAGAGAGTGAGPGGK